VASETRKHAGFALQMQSTDAGKTQVILHQPGLPRHSETVSAHVVLVRVIESLSRVVGRGLRQRGIHQALLLLYVK